jgi:hypothetical protein
MTISIDIGKFKAKLDHEGAGMTIMDALTILALGTGDIRRKSWEHGKWLFFKDSKIVNPDILTTHDLTADDWHWSVYD